MKTAQEFIKAQFITAKDECFMDGDKNNPALTVGRKYEILKVSEEYLTIIDDRDSPHDFTLDTIADFFN